MDNVSIIKVLLFEINNDHSPAETEIHQSVRDEKAERSEDKERKRNPRA